MRRWQAAALAVMVGCTVGQRPAIGDDNPRPNGYRYIGNIGGGPFWVAQLFAFEPRPGRECYVALKGEAVSVWCGEVKGSDDGK